jgi:hypothetical protein
MASLLEQAVMDSYLENVGSITVARLADRMGWSETKIRQHIGALKIGRGNARVDVTCKLRGQPIAFVPSREWLRLELLEARAALLAAGRTQAAVRGLLKAATADGLILMSED